MKVWILFLWMGNTAGGPAFYGDFSTLRLCESAAVLIKNKAQNIRNNVQIECIEIVK